MLLYFTLHLLNPVQGRVAELPSGDFQHSPVDCFRRAELRLQQGRDRVTSLQSCCLASLVLLRSLRGCCCDSAGEGMVSLELGFCCSRDPGVAHLQDLIYFGISMKHGAVPPLTPCRSQVGAG